MSCVNNFLITAVILATLILLVALFSAPSKREGFGGMIKSWEQLDRKTKACLDDAYYRQLLRQNPQDPGRAQALYEAAKLASYYNPYVKTSPNQYFKSYNSQNKMKRYLPIRR